MSTVIRCDKRCHCDMRYHTGDSKNIIYYNYKLHL